MIHPVENRCVNLQTLEALRSFQEEGQPDFLTELIDTYLNDSPQRLENLRQAVTEGDMTAVSRAAHAWKGSSGNLGAENLSRLLYQIELAAKSGDNKAVSDSFWEAETEFQSVKKFLGDQRRPA